MKKVLWGRIKKPIWKLCQFGNKRFPMCFRSSSAYICQGPKTPRAYTVQKPNVASFSLVSLSPHTRSRPGAERIRQGEGRLSRPPKPAVHQSDLTEKFQFRESHTEAETIKLLTKSLSPQKKNIHIYVCLAACEHRARFLQRRVGTDTGCAGRGGWANVTNTHIHMNVAGYLLHNHQYKETAP